MEEPRRDHSAIEFAADDEASNNSSSKPCIFKVPRKFEEKTPKSFAPESFSIGPLHYGKEHLKATEKIKTHYLANLLSRKPTPHTTLEEFKRSILEVEEKARQCYDGIPLDYLSKDEFVDMLVLDGCFIIELLRNNIKYIEKTIDEDDPVFSVRWVLQDLTRDFILLENQMPWFVLECLFKMTSEEKSGTESGQQWCFDLTYLALRFFGTIFSLEKALPSIQNGLKVNHILDVLRNSLVSWSVTKQQSSGDWRQIPTATILKESGFKFRKGTSINLLDIKYASKLGVLEIPSLLIQQTTCEAFRNLIIYEECYPNCEAKITSYAIFLSDLISTTKDIEVLRKSGVVESWMNPNDTLEFFKNIRADTYVKEFCYVQIYQDLRRPRWWLIRMLAYVGAYKNPVAFLSLYFTVYGLLLAALQIV